MEGLDRSALEQVSEYFKSLAEPTRLCLLNAMRDGEMSVSDLAEAVESTPANVSKHLSLLASTGFVARRTQGTSVLYRIADPDIYALCDLVCGHIAKRITEKSKVQAMIRRVAKRA